MSFYFWLVSSAGRSTINGKHHSPTVSYCEHFCSAISSLSQFYFSLIYRKIPKIRPGGYIFQRPFLKSLFLEGLIYGEKFAFQNRLG